MTEELSSAKSREICFSIWKKAFATFLGWTEDEVLAWAKRYEEGLNGEDPLFNHETPMYYVAPELVPDQLKKMLPVMDWTRLAWRLQDTIEKGALPAPPDSLVRLRDLLPMFEWMKEVNEYYRPLWEQGYGLSTQGLDKFDWAAAKERVNLILSEYGLSLPP